MVQHLKPKFKEGLNILGFRIDGCHRTVSLKAAVGFFGNGVNDETRRHQIGQCLAESARDGFVADGLGQFRAAGGRFRDGQHDAMMHGIRLP